MTVMACSPALTGTAEPAMANSIDTITALEVRGPAVQPLLRSELALARGFGWRDDIAVPVAEATAAANVESNTLELRWLGVGRDSRFAARAPERGDHRGTTSILPATASRIAG